MRQPFCEFLRFLREIKTRFPREKAERGQEKNLVSDGKMQKLQIWEVFLQIWERSSGESR